MRPFDDTPLARDGKVLIVAYDHGLEHGPVDFEDVPESADPERVLLLLLRGRRKPADEAQRHLESLDG